MKTNVECPMCGRIINIEIDPYVDNDEVCCEDTVKCKCGMELEITLQIQPVAKPIKK